MKCLWWETQSNVDQLIQVHPFLFRCAGGDDFVPKTSVDIVFGTDDTESCAPVVIIDDTSQENNEIFETIFTIPGVGMQTMQRLVANITIIDDDEPSESTGKEICTSYNPNSLYITHKQSK